jgi:transcriptional regulator with XRE-family HTH domain
MCAGILLSLVSESAEVLVSDGWAAVADAIAARVAELGITQKELAGRSGVSESTVRALLKNYRPRRRARHTLEDISTALGWPARHLDDLLGSAGQAADPDPLRAEVAELRSQVADLIERVVELERGAQAD